MKDRDNKHYWQRMAKLYAPFMGSSAPLYEAICERLLPHLERDMTVLELACGSGQLSFPLAGSVRRWEATDFSPKMIEEANKRLSPPNLRFSVKDATSLPYDISSFDAVVIANALHIMPWPEKALLEIHRVLKPGGLLMAPTFIWGTGVRFHLRAWLMARTGFQVFHKWSAEEFAAYVSQQGFTVMEREMTGGGIRPLCCLIARKH